MGGLCPPHKSCQHLNPTLAYFAPVLKKRKRKRPRPKVLLLYLEEVCFFLPNKVGLMCSCVHLCAPLAQVSRSESTASTEIPRTRGELEKLHGENEAAELIAKNFFEKITIKGVDHYIKQGYERRQAMSKTIDESMHLSKSAAAEEVTALESAFDSYKCALDLDFKTAWKPSSSGRQWQWWQPCRLQLASIQQ